MGLSGGVARLHITHVRFQPGHRFDRLLFGGRVKVATQSTPPSLDPTRSPPSLSNTCRILDAADALALLFGCVVVCRVSSGGSTVIDAKLGARWSGCRMRACCTTAPSLAHLSSPHRRNHAARGTCERYIAHLGPLAVVTTRPVARLPLPPRVLQLVMPSSQSH